jgi:hypothetical protein
MMGVPTPAAGQQTTNHYQKSTTFCCRDTLGMRYSPNLFEHARFKFNFKMAAVSGRTTRKHRINYKELNELSTADIVQQKKKKVNRVAREMYNVERVISARDTKQVRLS